MLYRQIYYRQEYHNLKNQILKKKLKKCTLNIRLLSVCHYSFYSFLPHPQHKAFFVVAVLLDVHQTRNSMEITSNFQHCFCFKLFYFLLNFKFLRKKISTLAIFISAESPCCSPDLKANIFLSQLNPLAALLI